MNKAVLKEGGLRTKGHLKQSNWGQPLISIITVVYNGEKYLEEAIKSVLGQAYDNLEYLIIDGGSTDGTLAIIKKYEERIDYWRSEADNGLYDALNKGITLARGNIIAALHADDIYFDQAVLENVAKEFNRDQSLAWLFGDICVVDESSRIKYYYRLPAYDWKLLLFANYCYVPQPATFLRKEIIEDLGGFDGSFKLAADYDFFLRLKDWQKAGKLDRPLVKFRFHGARLSESQEENARRENCRILEKYPLRRNSLLRWYYRALLRAKLLALNLSCYLKRTLNEG